MTEHLRWCDRHGHNFRTVDGHTSQLCLNCGADLKLEPPARTAVLPQVDPEGAALVPVTPEDYNSEPIAPRIGLPTNYDERKSLPIFDGVLAYFPLALLAVSEVSRMGNEQHNPGEPLHWARGKSMDQYNTLVRHLMDHRLGGRYDTDGGRHLAKAAWRALAALQLDIEQEALQADAHRSSTQA